MYGNGREVVLIAESEKESSARTSTIVQILWLRYAVAGHTHAFRGHFRRHIVEDVLLHDFGVQTLTPGKWRRSCHYKGLKDRRI